MANVAGLFEEVSAQVTALAYEQVADEELVRRTQQYGDRRACEYLLYKYRNLVRAKIKSYFLMGAERDDLIQIGMIGLWEAITDFRSDRDTSFAGFAKVCIQRQMISAIKAATRQKQTPLNSSVSLEAPPSGDEDNRNLLDMLMEEVETDPERIVLGVEGERVLQQSLREQLSPFEWEVLIEHRTGKSYKEIARTLNCKVKSIDNALSRIRRKLPALQPYLARNGVAAERR